MKIQRLPVCLLLFAFFLLNGQVFALMMPQDQPETIAESSEFKSTSSSQEVVEFVDWCAGHADHVNKIVFGQTVEGREMVAAVVSRKPYKLGQQDER